MPAANALVHDDAFSDATVSETVAATVSVRRNATVTMQGERFTAYPRFYREYFADCSSLAQVERQLRELTELSDGWDGYGTAAPTPYTATFALLVLRKIMQSRSPAPQVVPSSVGGIQLEWHEKDIDLELH